MKTTTNVSASKALETISTAVASTLPNWREEQVDDGANTVALAKSLTVPVVVTETSVSQKEETTMKTATTTKAPRKSRAKAKTPVTVTLSLAPDGKSVVATSSDGKPLEIVMAPDTFVGCKSLAVSTIKGYKAQVADLTAKLALANASLTKARELWVKEHPKAAPVTNAGRTFVRTEAKVAVRTACTSCGRGLTEAVEAYSQKNFGAPLCMTCQRKTLAEQKKVEAIVTNTEPVTTSAVNVSEPIF